MSRDVLIDGLDMIEIEAWISKCTRNTLTILLRNTDAPRDFVPFISNVILHSTDNMLRGVALQQETGGL